MTSTVTLRGRRGTHGSGLALVARLVLGVAPWRCGVLAWQAWHQAASTFTLRGRRGTHGIGLALVALTSTVTLRGRRGTHGIGLALVARLVLGVTPWRRGVLRGRRDTWRYPPSLCVAGLPLTIKTSTAAQRG